MKKIISSCNECGENQSILTQVSCLAEIVYLCSDCYKDKYSEEVRDEIEKENYLIPKFKKYFLGCSEYSNGCSWAKTIWRH